MRPTIYSRDKKKFKYLLTEYNEKRNSETEKELKEAGQQLSSSEEDLALTVKFLKHVVGLKIKDKINRAYTIAIGERENLQSNTNTGRGRKKKTRRRPTKRRRTTKRRRAGKSPQVARRLRTQ